MGIFAKGSQFPADVEVDTPQNRYGGQFTKDSAAGEALGEVISDVNSKAESANTTAGEIIADIEDLEGRVDVLENNTPAPRTSIWGEGWHAHQYNGVVEVGVIGATEGWTLPEGWRPPNVKYAPVVDLSGQSPVARVSVNPQGLVSLSHTTGACYGTLVYLL